MTSVAEYTQLYEELGEKYPETEHAHNEKFPGSRYWTVMKELHPYSSRSKRLIDIGCNDGVFTIPYCLRGGTALGIDISDSLIRKASGSARHFSNRCKFLRREVDSSHIDSEFKNSFDVALFSEVLEHLLNPDQALRNIQTMLVSGGDLILTTPTPLFDNPSLSFKYIYDLISGRRLVENHELDTDKLSKFQISSFAYRHDGYYPIALMKYVESFGFACKKYYTIDYLRTIEKSVLTDDLQRQLNFLSEQQTFRTRFLKKVRQFGLELEIPLRRFPIMNLFGSTNIAIFEKI